VTARATRAMATVTTRAIATAARAVAMETKRAKVARAMATVTKRAMVMALKLVKVTKTQERRRQEE
jgi:hypothetical protein